MGAPLEQRIADAYQLHQSGRLAPARQQYEALLLEHPAQVDVLFLLSVLLLGSEPQRATDLARQALDAAQGAGGSGVSEAELNDQYADCLQATGRQAEREVQHLLRARQLAAGPPERLLRLAGAQRRAGQPGDAVATLTGYLAQRPADLDARSNLGALLLQCGQVGPAIDQLQAVVRAQPTHLQALNNLGKACEEAGRIDLAAEHYRRATQSSPADFESWINLADALHSLSRLDEAIAAYERAQSINRQDWRVERGLNTAYVKQVPRWHFAMMNDRPRNQAYDRAIGRAVGQALAAGGSPLVLDIGAGSGLLSMMAARAGAPQVVACEMVGSVARMGQQIIADNGLADRIQLHEKKSTHLTLGSELPRRADLLITEIFDVGLLGENVLPVLAHARRELLLAGATIVPARARVWMMPVESQAMHEAAFASDRNACGFKLERFNRFARQVGYEQWVVNRFAFEALAEPIAVLDFDFSSDVPDRELVLSFSPTRSGPLHAWVFWFTLHLDAETTFDSGPFQQGSHWAQAVQVEPLPPAVQQGQPTSFRVSQSQSHIRFAFQG